MLCCDHGLRKWSQNCVCFALSLSLTVSEISANLCFFKFYFVSMETFYKNMIAPVESFEKVSY